MKLARIERGWGWDDSRLGGLGRIGVSWEGVLVCEMGKNGMGMGWDGSRWLGWDGLG